MGARPSRVGRCARVVTVTVVAVSLLASGLTASAASLGGINVGSIFVQDISIEISSPPPLVSTDFSGCSNFIDGWTDESGATWTSHSGNWQCLGSGVVRAQRRVPLANLTTDISRSSGLRVRTHIFDISHQNNRSGPGISLLGDDDGNFLYVIYERDDEQLSVGVTGEAPFAVVTPIGDYDTAVLSAVIDGGDLIVEFADVVVGPFDLATQAPDLVSNTLFGLVADNDNFSKFNNFTIELLP